jgi:hypothetical protein
MARYRGVFFAMLNLPLFLDDRICRPAKALLATGGTASGCEPRRSGSCRPRAIVCMSYYYFALLLTGVVITPSIAFSPVPGLLFESPGENEIRIEYSENPCGG